MALFGGSDQELRVTIKAKDEASAQINKLRLSVTDLAKGFAVGTIATDALRTGFRLLSGVVTGSIREFEQQAQAIAQTNAVLQSTHHAAGLTAKEIIDLSNALSKNTLYQDDMVLSAENMLLTFTNITKETFPRATQAVLDMSTALGQDLRSSAMQLGKALNNPIEGVAALQRVGVNFNNAQQEMIATMVKSGHTIEAQTFILKELEREFGGSAKSAYESASSVTKLQKTFAELKQDIGGGIVPALNNLFSAFQDVTSGMGENVDIGLMVFKAFSSIGEAAVALGNTLIQPVLGLAAMRAEGKRFLDSFSFFSAQEKKTRLQADEDMLASIGNLSIKSDEFLEKLVARNQAVIASWGKSTQAARELRSAGPAAYQATAAEADTARKKIEATRTAITDTHKSLEDLQRSLLSDDKAAARVFVEQEHKVSDLHKRIAEEGDAGRRAELYDELSKESAALEKARPTFAASLSGLVADERRRASLTDFERSVEDIQARKVDTLRTDLRDIVLNINFNQAVAGDDGIKQIIQKTIAQINREIVLLGTAGR